MIFYLNDKKLFFEKYFSKKRDSGVIVCLLAFYGLSVVCFFFEKKVFLKK